MLSYKIKTASLKIFSFLCIIGILYIGYILIKNTSNIIEKHDHKLNTPLSSSAKVNHATEHNLEYKIILKDSVFEGLNKNLNSYTVKAEQAIKDSDDKYKLDKINVLYELNDNRLLTINAKNGFLNKESNILNLQNDVKVFLEDIVFNTNDAQIDLIQKDIVSNSSVTLTYKNSSVISNSFSTQNDNNLIIFKGNVFTTINLLNF
nr:LPS export ABC transporter periplasmic protein LptC [Rickettsia endosymbiont of Ceutorhynchus assimilis]